MVHVLVVMSIDGEAASQRSNLQHCRSLKTSLIFEHAPYFQGPEEHPGNESEVDSPLLEEAQDMYSNVLCVSRGQRNTQAMSLRSILQHWRSGRVPPLAPVHQPYPQEAADHLGSLMTWVPDARWTGLLCALL